MARSGFLIMAAAWGIWTDSTGETRRAPCPEPHAFEAAHVRLPQGCEARRAGVWTQPTTWSDERAELSGLKVELKGLKSELSEALKRARVAEALLIEQANSHRADLEAIGQICTAAPPEPCAVWTPRAEGALFSAAACAAFIYGAQR